jgi:hypothetical protein
MTVHADLFFEAMSTAFIPLLSQNVMCSCAPNRYCAVTGFKCATLLHGPSKTFKPKKENSGFYITKKAEFAVLKCAFTINVRGLNDAETPVCPKNQPLLFPVGTGSSDGAFCRASKHLIFSYLQLWHT